jgi:hypothetical protein
MFKKNEHPRMTMTDGHPWSSGIDEMEAIMDSWGASSAA